MKKVLSFIAVLAVVTTCIFAQGGTETTETTETQKTLTVYAYDTFCGDWGAAGSVIPAFEEKTGIKVNLVSAGNATEVLNKVMLEGSRTQCDVILGITNDIADKAYDLLEPYSSPYLKTVNPALVFDPQNRLIPFDAGFFAFILDTKSGLAEPTCLADLTKDEYKGKVILIDPRGGSSVGVGLMMWTKNTLGESWTDWWKTMSRNALTMASGWSSAWGLFSEGEAPLVISYTTSPIYDESGTQKALVFPEGHEATIEAAGIVKGTKHRREAEAFIDFLLTDAQVDLAMANAMFTVNSEVKLPPEFANIPRVGSFFLNTDEQAVQTLKELTDAVLK